MINNENAPETNVQQGESKLKEYGKKSLAPLTDLVHKYKGDINPYVAAIGKGLQGAINALNEGEANDAERKIGQWFQEANEWFNGVKGKLEATEAKDLLNYLEEEAKKSPGLMFSVSYVAGLAIGRVGRQLGRKSLDAVGPSDDQMKH
jgi:hypothetical protein